MGKMKCSHVFVVIAALSTMQVALAANAGNMPGWGGQTTTQPRIQQPSQPLVSPPTTNTAPTVQAPQSGTWTAPGVKPGTGGGISPAQPYTPPSAPRLTPHTGILREDAPRSTVEAGKSLLVGTATQWAHWSEIAWDATKNAVNNRWKLQAFFRNVSINGPNANGVPGCLQGPDLGSPIRIAMAADGTPEQVADIFASTVAGAFKSWQDSVTVPGLPWYPSFAAWPGPQAPPTPNVPTPLIALAGRQVELTTSERLAARVLEQMPGEQVTLEIRTIIEEFCRQAARSFQSWLAGTMVQGVMGQGPVPQFAPPAVTSGPVTMGSVVSSPGVIQGNLR